MLKKTMIILLMIILPVCGFAAATPPVRVALVLGSGGARGYAHVGVIKALQRAGIPIDLIVASSSGSIIGGLYADSANADQLEKIMLDTNYHSFIDISLRPGQGGVITGAQELAFLSRHIQAHDFNDLKIKFVAVATNLTSGQAVSLTTGSVDQAIMASTALPGIVRPLHLNGQTLIDGGVTEPIPVSIAKRYHPQIIIAVDVSQARSSTTPTLAYGIYSAAYEIMWQRLTELSAQGADILIRPDVGRIGTFNLKQKEYLITAGEAAVTAKLPQIKALLRQHRIPLRSSDGA